MTTEVPIDLFEQARRAYWVTIREHQSWTDWVLAAMAEKVERTRVEHGLSELPPAPGGRLPPGPRPR